MLVGFLAVLIAVIYRVSEYGDSASVPLAASGPAAALPVAPGEVLAASASADRLVLTIGGGDPRIEVRRLPDGALVSVLRLSGAAAPAD